MLIRFETKNFLSFKDKVEFSLIAGDKRTMKNHIVQGKGIKILKTAVIYGANASGKSNLIKAIAFAKDLIVKGVDDVNCINQHYRLDSLCADTPSLFNFEVKIGDDYYSYGFEILLQKQKIVSEWLYSVSSSGEKMIFERLLKDDDSYQFEIGLKLDKAAKNRFEVYKEDMKNLHTKLFLKEINEKSLDSIKEQVVAFTSVYEWLKDTLFVIFPESMHNGLSKNIFQNSIIKQMFESYLNVFQTGITEIIPNQTSLEELNIPDKDKDILQKDLLKRLEINQNVTLQIYADTFSVSKQEDGNLILTRLGLGHKMEDGTIIEFDLDNESDGTKRLLDLIPALDISTNSDRTFVVDEIDRSMHSKLTLMLFELFLTHSNSEGQLIATTHESQLLDLSILRQDEIWFVEKENNQSKLYSLDSFKVRYDKSIMKDYLLGRYGGIPIFKSFQNIES